MHVGSHMSRIAPPKAGSSSPESHRYEFPVGVRACIVALTPGSAALIVAPAVWEIITDGIVMDGSTPGITVGPPRMLFAMRTPLAPIASAFATLTVNAQTPRSTSAMLPATASPLRKRVHPSDVAPRPSSTSTTSSVIAGVVFRLGPKSAGAAAQAPIAEGWFTINVGQLLARSEQVPTDRLPPGVSSPAPLIRSTTSPQMSEYDSFRAPDCHW